MNTGTAEKQVDLHKKYLERTGGFENAMDVITGEEKGNNFIVPSKKMFVLKLEK
jgi:hypothetical protein